MAEGVAPQTLAMDVDVLVDYLYVGERWRLGTELCTLQLAARRAAGDRVGEGATFHNLGALARAQGRMRSTPARRNRVDTDVV